MSIPSRSDRVGNRLTSMEENISASKPKRLGF
jgi:hypothetical protein